MDGEPGVRWHLGILLPPDRQGEAECGEQDGWTPEEQELPDAHPAGP